MRHYISIPFKWVGYSIRGLKYRKGCHDNFGGMSYSSLHWRLCVGDAQIKMKYYYTSEEVFDRLDIISKERKKDE